MAHSKLYIKIMNSKEWKQLRIQVIREHPVCQMCEAENHVAPSQCVHHIIPVESGRTEAECWELATRRSNCMALCFRHHADIHKAERSHCKQVISERGEQRLAAWADGLIKKYGKTCSEQGAKPPD